MGIYISTTIYKRTYKTASLHNGLDGIVVLLYRRTNKTASRSTGLDGIIVLLDGYDAS